MTTSSSTRIPISPKVLASKLNTIKENILDINKDLKDLNAAYYLPQSIHPLLISAVRQSGFVADHISNTLLVLNNNTAQEAGE